MDRLAGCYVNSSKEKVLTFSNSLLNAEDDEIHKYLEIARKVLSGKIGDAQLCAPVVSSECQRNMLAIVKSGLKDEHMLDALFDKIIDTYEYAGSFLILLYHDAYDVITKTSDNKKLDESEYVHEFVLCAVCPVELSKPGLGYLAGENRIGARIRDWVVSAPMNGFVYPSFEERMTDTDHVQFFCKNTKEPHMELLTDVLGGQELTLAQTHRAALESAVNDACKEEDGYNPAYAYMDLQQELQYHLEENGAEIVTAEDIQKIAEDAGIPEENAKKIAGAYKEDVCGEEITNDELIDEKVLKKSLEEAEKRNLKDVVKTLSERLKEQESLGEKELLKQKLLQIAELEDGAYRIAKADFDEFFG